MENKEIKTNRTPTQEKADRVWEQIIQELKQEGKTDQEIQALLDAFGV